MSRSFLKNDFLNIQKTNSKTQGFFDGQKIMFHDGKLIIKQAREMGNYQILSLYLALIIDAVNQRA